MSVVASFLVLVVTGLAGFLATRVEDEMQYLEKPLRAVQAISGLALLAVLPWWGALIIAGALAFGGIFLLGGVAALAALAVTQGEGFAAVAVVLGILAGGRWALDRTERGAKGKKATKRAKPKR